MTLYHNKGIIQQEDMVNSKYYAPNLRAPKYMKQILTELNGEIHSNIIVVKYFNAQLESMDRSSKQKFNKKASALNDTLKHIA